MFIVLIPLVALVFQATACAIHFSLSKIYGKTDRDHYMMLERSFCKEWLTIITVTNQSNYQVRPNCNFEWTDIKKVSEANNIWFGLVTMNGAYLSEERGPKESPDSYIWLDTFFQEPVE